MPDGTVPRDSPNSPEAFCTHCLKALVVLGIVLLFIATLQSHARYKNFAIHEDGRVYRSSWVEPDIFEELVARYGIRTVVNLCDPSEKQGRIAAERRAVEKAGARLVELVYPQNASSNVGDAVFAETEKLLEDPAAYPIWIHCMHGRQRTAKAIMIYDLRVCGLSAEASLARTMVNRKAHRPSLIAFAHHYEAVVRRALPKSISCPLAPGW